MFLLCLSVVGLLCTYVLALSWLCLFSYTISSVLNTVLDRSGVFNGVGCYAVYDVF